MRYTERLEEIGARPSIGTVADSYDNALAETTNGLNRTKCVCGSDAPRPWDDVDELGAPGPGGRTNLPIADRYLPGGR